jgi:hypothetical protein
MTRLKAEFEAECEACGRIMALHERRTLRYHTVKRGAGPPTRCEGTARAVPREKWLARGARGD